MSFFYDLAKAANLRMAFALAHELAPHGATAVALTPGWLRSEAMLEVYEVTEATWRDATRVQPHFAISESPAFVGRAVAALAADPERSRWNGQSLSSGQLAGVYGFTDLDGSQPDAWRYMVEVQDPAGRPTPPATADDLADQARCMSPSMGMTCPEIDRAASEARNTASAPMSDGSTNALSDWFTIARARPMPDAPAVTRTLVIGVALR